ncbi:MAG: hypothetical protein OXG81_02715 [Acidobacteria bacterium]|nr:hypothetical protein [Acidobacteriota bacterium]
MELHARLALGFSVGRSQRSRLALKLHLRSELKDARVLRPA